MTFVHIYYSDNLYALSVQYRYNTNNGKHERWTINAIKSKKTKTKNKKRMKERKKKSIGNFLP